MTINKTSLKNGAKANLRKLKRVARWAYDGLKANLEKLSTGTCMMLTGLAMAAASGVVFLLGAGIARIAHNYCLPEHVALASVLQFIAGAVVIISYIVLCLVGLLDVLAVSMLSQEARSPKSGWHYGFASMQVMSILVVAIYGPFGLIYLYSRDTLSFEAVKMTLRTSVRLMCAEVDVTDNISISPFVTLCIVVGIALIIYDHRNSTSKKEK